ncbi:MAG TPA: hypothetical protein VK151_00070 [Fluviicola sp.]|nr:hypothetical protein [Fluviicola sp.]
MKLNLVLVTFTAFLHFNSFSQADTVVIAEMYFGGGFGSSENDSIDLRINQKTIYHHYKLYSIKSYAKANGEFKIVRVKKRLYALTKKEIIYIGTLKKDSLKIVVVHKSETYDLDWNIQVRKYLICSLLHGKIEFTQLENSPEFL